MAEPTLCTATTKKGNPCKSRPMHDREVCKQHSGDANVGQRSKLTEATHARIVQLIRAGNYRETAARIAGIGMTTFYRWMEVGEADEEHDRETPHREFWRACTRVTSESEAIAVSQLMQNVSNGDQRAIEWFLERRHPGNWKQRQEIEHAGTIRRGAPDVPNDEERLRDVSGVLDEIGALEEAA